MIVSVVGASASILLARYIYLKKPEIASRTATRFKGLYNLLWNKYYVDEIYDAVIVNPIVTISRNVLWKIADNKIIDGTVNGVAKLVDLISASIRKIQTGVAQLYALVMVLGIAVALLWIILSF